MTIVEVRVLVVCDADNSHGMELVRALAADGVPVLRFNLSDVVSSGVHVGEGYIDLDVHGEQYRLTTATTVWWCRSGRVGNVKWSWPHCGKVNWLH